MIKPLSWGKITPISIRDIDSERAVSRTRQFIAAIGLDRRGKLFDVYLCADQRNGAVRNILNQLGNVRIFSNAGNVVYAPSRRPSVIIAHGRHCGAVDYATQTQQESTHELPAIFSQVDDEVIANAFRQLGKIPREFRAGIIYFNHEDGTVSHFIEDEQGRLFRHFAVCEFIFHELETALKQRFSKAQLEAYTKEQNPDFTLLCNPEIQPQGFNYFEVNLQKGGRFDGIIRDSLIYAISHALTGPQGGFSATKAVIMAFYQDMGITPKLYRDFLEPDRKYLEEYMKRGGSIYLLKIGNLPSEKQVYKVQRLKVEGGKVAVASAFDVDNGS